jgi:hypothetical protein
MQGYEPRTTNYWQLATGNCQPQRRSTKHYVRNYNKNMQNKAKFKKVKLNVNKGLTKDYDQMDTWSIGTKQSQTNPIQTQYKPKTKPIRTQFKANSNPNKPNFRGIKMLKTQAEYVLRGRRIQAYVYSVPSRISL